jgi:hypothetical protein
LQVAIDLLPGRAGYEQWLVANLAGPALAAAFANSGSAEGRPAGPAGARTRIWQNVDLCRTGYDGRHLDLTDPVGAYAAFAAAAPRLPIPQAEQPSYHLSTLFPPVRPRSGYLEVRYLDAQPYSRIGEVVATVVALLCDSRARHDAPGSWFLVQLGAWLAPRARRTPLALTSTALIMAMFGLGTWSSATMRDFSLGSIKVVHGGQPAPPLPGGSASGPGPGGQAGDGS